MSESPYRLSEHPIVFYDGVCGLCNRFVDWLLVHDKKQVFRYAPLQGSTAKSLLGTVSTEDPTSVILLAEGTRAEKATAVAMILRQLGSPWAALGSLIAHTPSTVADKAYDLVAAHRYQLFGKRAECRLPSSSERALFFD